MKIKSVTEHGRIVKGVNTTVDVGPNEITHQAKKFGNSVDKDGHPPTLSKKVKGSKTNVAFNLGLTESKEIGSSTEIYVDMDGVLADFFTEWGKLMKVDNWWNIKDEHNIDDALQKIRDTDNFWLDLPLTSNAKNLLNLIKQVKGSYIILSSPLPGDKNSEPHKREWIKKNLSFFPPKEVLIRHDKETFATQQDGTPNILIDDYGVNIQKWEAKGGVGFKHKDHKFERTVGAIKQHMQEPTKEDIIEQILSESPLHAVILALAGAGVAVRELVKRFGLKAVRQALEQGKKNKIKLPKPANDHGGFVDDLFKAVKRKRTPDEIARTQQQMLPHYTKKFKKEVAYITKQYKDGKIDKKHFEDSLEFLRVMFKRRTGKDAPMDDLLKVTEKWSAKYKKSINCSNPKGFSQKAHCAGRKKKESYSREELPQIKNKHLENIDHEIVFLNIDEVKPVQKERVMENFKRQVDRLVEGIYSPVVVDCHNRIVNGHHRYDAIRLLGQTTIPVARIPHTLECIIENFADGKRKGKSRPGRVKRAGASCNGSVTALRKRAKNASGEKAKMYHWCANMKSGRKKS